MTFAIFTTTLLKILYFLWSDRNRPFFLLGTGVGFFLTAVSFSIDWIKRPKAESQSLFNQYNVSCVFHQRTLFFTKAANPYLFFKMYTPQLQAVCVCVLFSLQYSFIYSHHFLQFIPCVLSQNKFLLLVYINEYKLRNSNRFYNCTLMM